MLILFSIFSIPLNLRSTALLLNEGGIKASMKAKIMSQRIQTQRIIYFNNHRGRENYPSPLNIKPAPITKLKNEILRSGIHLKVTSKRVIKFTVIQNTDQFIVFHQQNRVIT